MLHWRTGSLLVGLYVLLVLVPLIVGLALPTPPVRAFWLEVSVALAFVGLGQLALQFALIARFQRISEPFGIDLVMQYHRQIDILAVLLVLAHPLVLIAWRPAYASMLSPVSGGPAALPGERLRHACGARAPAGRRRSSPADLLCGPDAMMVRVERILLDCGVPHREISMERFHLV